MTFLNVKIWKCHFFCSASGRRRCCREAGISGRSGPLRYSGRKARDTISHNGQSPVSLSVTAAATENEHKSGQ